MYQKSRVAGSSEATVFCHHILRRCLGSAWHQKGHLEPHPRSHGCRLRSDHQAGWQQNLDIHPSVCPSVRPCGSPVASRPRSLGAEASSPAAFAFYSKGEKSDRRPLLSPPDAPSLGTTLWPGLEGGVGPGPRGAQLRGAKVSGSSVTPEPSAWAPGVPRGAGETGTVRSCPAEPCQGSPVPGGAPNLARMRWASWVGEAPFCAQLQTSGRPWAIAPMPEPPRDRGQSLEAGWTDGWTDGRMPLPTRRSQGPRGLATGSGVLRWVQAAWGGAWGPRSLPN